MSATPKFENEEDYTVHNNKEIVQILKKLIDDKTNLRVSFNQGNEDYITNIISVDNESGHLYFDLTVDDVFNQRLTNSATIMVSKDSGIRIKWNSSKHTQVALVDGKALQLEIPTEIIRLQRRELFRLPTPSVKPLTCQIHVPNLINPQKLDPISYHLVDVSLGGVGLIVPNKVHPSIAVGKLFDDCRIEFPDVGEARLTLEVRNIIKLPSENNDEKFRIGMQYVQPTRANENMIHRYTFDLERAMLAARSN